MRHKDIVAYKKRIDRILKEEDAMPKRDNVNWAQAHKDMGCEACRFADKKKVGKGPCCQHIQGPSGNPCTREAERAVAEKELNQW